MSGAVIRVQHTEAGWMVHGDQGGGPFQHREEAIRLAKEMVATLRELGEDARLFVAEETPRQLLERAPKARPRES